MSTKQMSVDNMAGVPKYHRKEVTRRKWLSKLDSVYKRQFGYDWREKHKDLLEKYDWMIQDDPG